MKLNLHHISFTLLLAILAPAGFNSANAQEAPHISDSYDTHSNTDRVMYMPGGEGEPIGGGSSRPQPAVIKDSVSTTTPAYRTTKTPGENLRPSQARKQNQEDDESILSFNFLYYIIQKYKLQDIVD